MAYVASSLSPEPTAATIDRVWIRDRIADTARPVAELDSAAPGVSGDGCVVAYVVTSGPPEPTATLTLVDRCAAEPTGPLPAGRTIDTAAAGDGVDAAPALSFDGSTIVWSTGDEIRRYVRTEAEAEAEAETGDGDGAGTEHRLTDAFDTELLPTAHARTGASVDVSADGRAIVFVAGTGSAPFEPDVANVYVWSQLDGSPPVIELLSVTPSGEPGTASSGSPTISADGAVIAFGSESADLVAVDGDPVTTPFVAVVDRSEETTMSVVAEDASLPVLSADATHLVHRRGASLRSVSFSDDGSFTDTEILSAAEPAGAAALSRHARWVVFASAAPLVTDSDGVEIVALDLRPSGDGDVIDTTTTAVTTTTTSTTTTTVSGSPEVGGAASTVTAAPTTSSRTATPLPRPAVPMPRPPAVDRGGVTFRGSDGSGAFLDSTVTSLRFEPTIVGAGRRRAASTLTVGRATDVTSARVGNGPFGITADNCSGRFLDAGQSCVVEVDFRPDTIGAATGVLTIEFSDGSVVSATLDGVGTAQPTLQSVPAVVAPGQVVTVFGSGFPSGSSVELQLGVERDEVTVDSDGTFAHVLVVMAHTPAGPMELVVAGQPDRFADVSGELLVSSRSVGSGSAAFRHNAVSGLGR